MLQRAIYRYSIIMVFIKDKGSTTSLITNLLTLHVIYFILLILIIVDMDVF
jgi:hypothetical protein